MRLLVEHGADPKIATKAGDTPLMAAAGIGWAANWSVNAPIPLVDAVKYCVELGNDVNAADNRGYTALHGAAYLGNNDMVNYLVSKGAKVDAKSKAGDTVADMANGPTRFGQPHPETVALLEKLGSPNSHNCRSDQCVVATRPTGNRSSADARRAGEKVMLDQFASALGFRESIYLVRCTRGARHSRRPVRACRCGRDLLVPVRTRPRLAQIYSSTLPLDHPRFTTSTGPLDDPIARFVQTRRSRQGLTRIRDDVLGYLPSLLEQLGINPDSQALVFSKTSFQATKISPRNPRAIYFNDDVAVGLGARRRRHGDRRGRSEARRDLLFTERRQVRPSGICATRRRVCTAIRTRRHSECREFSSAPFFPTLAASRSQRRDHHGSSHTVRRSLGRLVRQRDPRRAARSRQRVRPRSRRAARLQVAVGRISRACCKEFNTSGYLTPISDIVALMTFEHQTQMTNLMTRLDWESRIGAPNAEIAKDIDAIVKYMLFADEAPLPEPIQGVSTFTKTFAQRGPRDHQGRSPARFRSAIRGCSAIR